MSNDDIPESLNNAWTHNDLTTAYRSLHTRFLTAQTARPFQLERQLHNAHNRLLSLEHEISRLQMHQETNISKARAQAQSFRHDIQERDARAQESQATLAEALAANSTFSAHIQALERRLDDLQSANRSMRNPLQYYHSALADASRMQQQNEKLTKEICGLQVHIEDLERVLDGHQTTIDGLETDADDRKLEYEDLQRQMDDVTGELVQARKDLLRAKRELDEVRDGNVEGKVCEKKCKEMEGRLKMLRDTVVGFGKLSEDDVKVFEEVAGLGDGEGTKKQG